MHSGARENGMRANNIEVQHGCSVGFRGARQSKYWYESTVSFHNFKSQNVKLSVSNPKNKYVAYLSVLSQIPNCQGLGRKNEHEVLKTDRTQAQRSPTQKCALPKRGSRSENVLNLGRRRMAVRQDRQRR